MTGAERKRLERERKRKGLAVWPVEGDDVAVPEMLIATGYLPRRDADDRKSVAAALSRLVADLEARDIKAA